MKPFKSKFRFTQAHRRGSVDRSRNGYARPTEDEFRSMGKSNWYQIIQAGITTRKALRVPHHSR